MRFLVKRKTFVKGIKQMPELKIKITEMPNSQESFKANWIFKKKSVNLKTRHWKKKVKIASDT